MYWICLYFVFLYKRCLRITMLLYSYTIVMPNFGNVV